MRYGLVVGLKIEGYLVGLMGDMDGLIVGLLEGLETDGPLVSRMTDGLIVGLKVEGLLVGLTTDGLLVGGITEGLLVVMKTDGLIVAVKSEGLLVRATTRSAWKAKQYRSRPRMKRCVYQGRLGRQ